MQYSADKGSFSPFTFEQIVLVPREITSAVGGIGIKFVKNTSNELETNLTGVAIILPFMLITNGHLARVGC